MNRRTYLILTEIQDTLGSGSRYLGAGALAIIYFFSFVVVILNNRNDLMTLGLAKFFLVCLAPYYILLITSTVIELITSKETRKSLEKAPKCYSCGGHLTAQVLPKKNTNGIGNKGIKNTRSDIY